MLKYDNSSRRGPRVSRVDFGMFSADEIMRMAVTEVKEMVMYSRGFPVPNSINDLLLGSCDRRLRCSTCKNTVQTCPGHVGRIDLPLPCYHIGFVDHVIKVLRSVCFFCSRLVITPEEALALHSPTDVGKAIFLSVYGTAKVRRKCAHCGAGRPSYTRLVTSIKLEWPHEMEWACADEKELATRPFTAATALSILTWISDDDAKLMGFCPEKTHPRDLILTQLLVPPPIARPAIMASEGSRSRGQDDITCKLQEINKRCIELRSVLALEYFKNPPEPAEAAVLEPLACAERIHIEACSGYAMQDNVNHTAVSLSALPKPPTHGSGSRASTAAGGGGGAHSLAGLSADQKASAAFRGAIRAKHSSAHVSLRPPSAEIIDRWLRLQLFVYSLINNTIRGQTTSDARRPAGGAKSLTDRLKGRTGKEGRVRGNLMGKRVNHSARSVITPDPNIAVDQIGVPLKIAKTLTVPERVTPENIEEMRQRVMIGPFSVMGAESVITSDDVVIQLESCKSRKSIQLQYGWIVERYLKNGDYVIFNRQPSLHKMSMMGHRVVLVSGMTFRLNLSCVNPYNADFDGDEMNMHVTQSPAAQAEVMALMAVTRQLISPQSNRPCMSIVQDTLLASLLITLPGTFLDRKQMMQLLSLVKHSPVSQLPLPAIAHTSEPRWTGHQLLSTLLPKNMNLLRCSESLVTNADLPLESDLAILNGQLVFGTLSKSTLGTASNGIIDVMVRDFGPQQTAQYMGDMQRVLNHWMQMRGFSVGIADCVLADEGLEQIAESIRYGVTNAHAILNETTIPESMSTEAEMTVVRILSKILVQTGNIVQAHLATDNAIGLMVKAGSKGNPINLTQICGCVGQQSIEGGRINPESSDRTLSCYAPGETSVYSHGFVQNSYAQGLDPQEYFFHAMGGREGLVDTAVKTATTGYIQRRLMKAMEDNRLAYDGTVRTAQNAVVQFKYGGDGSDPCRIEKQAIRILHSDRRSLVAVMCDHPVASKTQLEEVDFVYHNICKVRNGRNKALQQAFDVNNVLLPINLNRLVRTWKRPGAEERPTQPIVSEDAARAIVSKMLATIAKIRDGAIVCSLNAAIGYSLCTRWVRKRRFSAVELERLCEYTTTRVLLARASAGDMVGCIAAQSVGELCTQMTLNTFHLSGVGNTGVTMGMPRLKEILDFTKKLHTPVTILRFGDAVSTSPEALQVIADTLPLLKLADAVRHTTLRPSSEESDESAQAAFLVNSFFTEPLVDPGNWIIHVALNKDVLRRYFITPPDVVDAFRRILPPAKAHVVSSETNCVNWWVELRFAHISRMARAIYAPMQKLNLSATNDKEGIASVEHNLTHRVMMQLLEKVVLAGHPGIRSSTVAEEEVWDERLGSNVRRHHIRVQGSILATASCMPWVQWNICTTNDIAAVLDRFGIEAANAVIFKACHETITNDGTYVDPRHTSLIADTMTHRGFVVALNRHGLNHLQDTGPLARCSFEETTIVLYEAALFGETDDARGVTQNIMTGQTTCAGTGAFDILQPQLWNNFRANAAKHKKNLFVNDNRQSASSSSQTTTEEDKRHAPKRQLVKTSIRRVVGGSITQEAPASIGYIRTPANKIGTPQSSRVDMPFVRHEHPVTENSHIGKLDMYRPTSPKMVSN